MSLFPAYSGDAAESSNYSKTNDLSKEKESSSWLRNSSYTDRLSSINTTVDLSSGSSDETLSDIFYLDAQHPPSTTLSTETPSLKRRRSKHSKKTKKEKRKHEKEKVKPEYEQEVENVYFEDKYRDRGNNTVNTLCSRVRPSYGIGKKCLGFISHKQSKKDTFERYYVKNIDVLENVKKKDTVIKRDSTKDTSKPEEPLPSWCTDLEEVQKSKVKEYNERLSKEPKNVQLWLEYIQFQDTLTNFQRFQSAKDVHRALILKKLSILEKAMEHNAESMELFKLKLFLMGELYPADQFSNELETLVKKDSGNVVLWQTFIMVTQASVSMCTVPKVLRLYSKCFSSLKRMGQSNPYIYEESLLRMLYWCLTFLRHTGLWEKMWETIRLNLSLTLSLKKDSLSFQKMIDEKKLIGMEEVILMSRLPLNQLWQRTESLRENYHWISVSRDELDLVGDSCRFVVLDDVVDFVHILFDSDTKFRMAIHFLLSLKVPLLPTRDYMLKELSLKEFEWGAESSEVLLPFLYPSVGEMAGQKQRKELLSGILEGHLTSGPQYLTFHPAQESYLDFIREIFRTIAENLSCPHQQTSIYIWWLRFERLLVYLHKDEPLKYDSKKKKLKATLKEFLKREENRNNLYFYKEFALIEKEMGRFDSCVNILETAIQSQGTCLSRVSDYEDRKALLNLYRTLFQVLLDAETYKESHDQKILNVFEQIIPEKHENQLSLVENYFESCIKDYLQNVQQDYKNIFFLPSLECDTIVCYAYLLYTRDHDINKIGQIFASCINHCEEFPNVQEMLYESFVSILQLHCERTQEDLHVLKETLNSMLHTYPDNFYALSVLASIESELPIWKFNNQRSNIQLWRSFAMCLASRKRIRFLKELDDSVGTTAAINKLLSFHRTLARTPATRCCPLLWRLYMLLLREYNLCEKKGEEVYHESVAQCPWARSIYIDAAEVAPQLLTQIQDVIREKELRMHVTPEELDILRS